MKYKRVETMAYLALPLAFFLAMFFIFPFRQRFEFDLDEGLNVMKALLVARGYPLYSQVWSDQPPLLTYLLAGVIRGFGANIDALRTLVLLFSTVLMAAAMQYLRITWGFWHAMLGGLLVFLLPFYTSLSVAVMVGLPAIALAVVALLALEAWHRRRQERWLVLSAILLAASVLIKLFTGFLAPIFVVGLLLGERQGPAWSARLRPAVVWCLVFGALTVTVVLVAVGPSNLGQLVLTHLSARQDKGFLSLAESQSISYHLRDAWAILALAAVGSLFTLLERRWTSFYLLAWAAVAYVLLSFHAPVWYHHQFLITIPAAMLAAIALGEAIRWIPQVLRSRPILGLRALLILLALAGGAATVATRARLTYHNFILPAYLIPPEAPSAGREAPFLAEMTSWANRTHWVVTDLPMYAFRVGLLVPPPLAAITDKRLASGEITEAQIIQVIETYKPEQVLLGRFDLPAVEDHVREDYRRIYQFGRKTLYLLGELKRNP
jgi:4-amino-4-deoxy-L-arabinose transferase-like glycosyltransferase